MADSGGARSAGSRIFVRRGIARSKIGGFAAGVLQPCPMRAPCGLRRRARLQRFLPVGAPSASDRPHQVFQHARMFP